MCPNCIGSAVMLLTGASSAGGVALMVSRTLGSRSSKSQPCPRAPRYRTTLGGRGDTIVLRAGTGQQAAPNRTGITDPTRGCWRSRFSS
jgi:hypothetical protein